MRRQPSKGNGVGLNMILAREGAGESVSFERNKRVQGDDVLLSTHQTTNPEGKAQWKTKQKPSTMTSGQLRMLRIGDEVTYWAAEGNSNSFRKVDIDQYCAAAINTIFLAAYPGFAQNAVDVRIKDLRVRQTAVAAADQRAEYPGWYWRKQHRRSRRRQRPGRFLSTALVRLEYGTTRFDPVFLRLRVDCSPPPDS